MFKLQSEERVDFEMKASITQFLDEKITEIGLMTRTKHTLLRAGFRTVGDIINYIDKNKGHLNDIRSFGMSSYCDLMDRILQHWNITMCTQCNSIVDIWTTGYASGIEDGINIISELVVWLNEQERIEEALNVASDVHLRERVAKEMFGKKLL